MVIFIVVCFILINCPVTYERNKMQVYVNKIVMCPGFNKSPIQLKNVKIINNAQRNFLVSYQVVVSKYVGDDLHLKATVQRCASKEAPDTCTKYANFFMKNVCRLSNVTNTFYSPFTTCLKPPLTCPIVKKTFYGENCTYNMDAFRMFTIAGFHWKMQIEFLNSATNEAVFCAQAEAGFREFIY